MPAANDAVWIDVLPSGRKFMPALEKDMAGMKGRLGKVGLLAGAALVAGISAATVKFTKDAALLDTQMREVVTLFGETGKAADESLKWIREGVRGLSDEFGIAQETLTSGLYQAISAGVPRDNAFEFMKVASQAAIGGVTDVETAVDGLTTTINAFGLEASDAQAVSDSMFTAVKGGKTNFEELSASLFNVAPAAAAAGVSFQEVNAAIATLTAGGTPTSVATTQIRAALTGLQKPSKDLDKIFQALGYKNAQLAIESEGLGFALDAVKKASKGNNGALQELLGSSEAVAAANVLAGTGAEKFRAELEAQEKAAGATGDAFEVVQGGLESQVKVFRTQMRNAGLALGQALLPHLNKVMTSVNKDLIPALRAMSRFVKDNATAFKIFAGVLGAAVSALVIYRTTVGVITAATKAWAVVQGLLNKTIRLNPIGMFVTALALLAAGLTYVFTKTEWGKKVWDAAWSGIRTGLSAAWSFIQPILAAVAAWVGPRLAASFTALKIAVGVAFTVIKTYISAWWAVASTIFSAVAWYVSNVLAPPFLWLWNNVIGPAFSGIGSAISWAWTNVISPVFNALSGGVGGLVTAFTGAKDGIKTAWDKLTGIVEGPINTAKRIIGGFIDLINGIPGLPDIPNPFKDTPMKPATGSDRAMAGRAPLRRATGGPVFGPGSGTSDSILTRLSNGEHVWTAQEVRALGGHAKMYALRAAARAGQFHIPGFATGGAVVPGAGKRHTSGYPWATWAGDFPNPIGTPVRAWKDGAVAMVRSLTTSYGKHMLLNHTDGTSSLYAHLSSFAKSFGDRVAQGEMIGRVGSTGNSTGPHLHFETRGGPFTGGSGGGSVWDSIKGAAGQIGGWIKSHLLDKANLGGLFGNVSGLFSDIGNGVKDWALEKLHGKSALGFLASMSPAVLASRAFDSGGLAGGTGFMAKNTIAPERVLSAQQTRAFEQMVRHNFGESALGGGQVELSEDSIRALGDYILDGSRNVAASTVSNYDASRRFDDLYGGNR